MKRFLLALPLAVIGGIWAYWLFLPWGLSLRWREPGRTAVMRQRIDAAAESGYILEVRQQWVSLERIAPNLRRAVVVAEDGRFYDHAGIDWNALREEFRYQGDDDFSWFSGDDLRALRASLDYYRENRDKVRGRSTITQQLAKNLYFSTERSVLRKVEEFVVARRLERMLSKDRILELYLNMVEWGPGIFGAEAAAQHYFGRSAASLTRHQAAQLAATLPHPLRINPGRNPGRMAWRVALIERYTGGRGPVETVPLGDLAPVAGAEEERLLGEPVPDPPPGPVEPAAPLEPEPDTAVSSRDTLAPPDTTAPVGDTTAPLPSDRPPSGGRSR